MLPPTFVPGFHDADVIGKMKYNPLGRTGMQVSQLSFGGGALAACLYGDFSEEDAIETVREALKQGINYIDTAYWYGQGSSEEILGKALKGIPRKAYYIATKVGRYEQELSKMFDFTKEKTLTSVDTSLKKLGLDYVDIIQVHDIEFASSLDIVLNETLPTLEEVVKLGKARHIGVTGYPVSVLREAVEKSSGKIDTVLSYTRATLIDDTLSQNMPFFQTRVGVISAAGPAMGLLTNGGPQSWHPASSQVKEVCKAASNFCQERGVELGTLAMHHTLTQPGPATHLVGMNNLQLLKTNLDILYNGLSPLEKEVMELVKAKFFSSLKQSHWEGIEVEQYKKKMNL